MLPPRPRPLTVLRRPGGAVQVGLDVKGAFVVPGAAEDAAGVLAAWASGCPTADLPRRVRADPAWTAAFVSGMRRRGLLVSRPTVTVEVWGDGDLARRIVEVAAGEDVVIRQRPSPSHDDAPSPGASGRLVVLCLPTAEPDRGLTTALTRSGQPYLVVRAEPERAVVGPLVQPGRSACVACTDRARQEIDPDWTGLLAQLCRHVPRPDAVLNAWAAAGAAAQLRAWAAGSAEVGRTLELDAVTGVVAVRGWATHPECPCTGAATGQVA